jgi:hypothetical protein
MNKMYVCDLHNFEHLTFKSRQHSHYLCRHNARTGTVNCFVPYALTQGKIV